MKKIILYMLFALIFVLPLSVEAAELSDTKVSMSCTKSTLYSGDETKCTVYATAPDGVEFYGVQTSVAIPSQLSLVGKMEAASEWEGEFEDGETKVYLYTLNSPTGKAELFSFVVKAGTVTEDDSVTLMVNDLSFTDVDYDEQTISGINTTIQLKKESATGGSGDSGTDNDADNTTNNTIENPTNDKESPETGASIMTVVGGVALLAAGAFIVYQATRKSKFSKIN